MNESEEYVQMQFLHQDLVVRSNKQQSAQGSVYYVKKIQENSLMSGEFVLKIYPIADKKSYDVELQLLNKVQTLQNNIGFPKLISHIEGQEQSEILIEALGPNIRNLQRQCPMKRFSHYTVLSLTLQLLERIRRFHQLGYIHNDLKLENVLIGHKDPSVLYLIDFGLCQKYLEEDGSHVKKNFCKKFSGNFLFASLNSCRGNNKSRRDDVESAIYIMIYLMNNNYLPWCDIEEKCKQEYMEFKDILKERLEIEYTKRLFKLIPKELTQMLKYILTLNFDQEPDYDYVIKQIQTALNKEQAKYKNISVINYEWTVSLATKAQCHIQLENKNFDVSEQSLGKQSLHFLSKYIGSDEEKKQFRSSDPSKLQRNSSRIFEMILDQIQDPTPNLESNLSNIQVSNNQKKQIGQKQNPQKIIINSNNEENKQDEDDGEIKYVYMENSQGEKVLQMVKKSSQFARLCQQQSDDENNSDYEEENLEVDEIDENIKKNKDSTQSEIYYQNKQISVQRQFNHHINDLKIRKENQEEDQE